MSTVEHVLPVEAYHAYSWSRYLLDSVLVFGGTMLVTGIIYAFQLYPRIPNISIVYLLVVLALASTRGRYASILASLVAFLSFDFFLVPPLYVFTINRVEEWIALFVFLVTAILSSDEKAIAAWVMTHGRTMGLYDDGILAPSTSARFVQRVIVRSTATGRAVGRSLRLIPLKLGEKVVGVLRLRVLEDPRRHTCLLQDDEVKHLLIAPPAALVLIRLTVPGGLASAPSLRVRFLSWWHRLWGQRNGTVQAQNVPVMEEPLWIRRELHHLG